MRILFCHRVGGAWGYITDGMINALRNKNHTVQRWDGELSSWNGFAPDLYVGCSGHKQNIPSTRSCKVAIHVNPYGPVEIKGINESAEAINWAIAQNPDLVFGYGFKADKILWSYWESKCGIKWIPMPTAADKTLFTNLNGEREHDVVYLGGRWEYKAQTIDEYLLPVLRSNIVSCKVHGWGDWPDGICKGRLSEDKVVGFLNSGKIAPCISERHTQQYGIDIPERVWKVALCGALAIHDAVPTIRRELKSVVFGQNPQNFLDLCVHYSRNDSERIKKAAEQTSEVLNNHTYHHRMSYLLANLGFHTQATEMIQ